MTKIFRPLAPVFVVLMFSCFVSADDFNSITFDSTSSQTIRVHGDQFMVIRNFTQEMGSMRGLVMAAKPDAMTGTTVNVLAAAILSNPTLEVINNVVIAGPADVTFTCGTGGGNCFISFKKDSN
jgi:hypothetical protein